MRAYFATGLDPNTLLVAEGNLTGMAYVELPTTAGTVLVPRGSSKPEWLA